MMFRFPLRAVLRVQGTATGMLLASASVVAALVDAGASLALGVVYAFGFVTGSLLVEPRDERATLALAVVRLAAGGCPVRC